MPSVLLLCLVAAPPSLEVVTFGEAIERGLSQNPSVIVGDESVQTAIAQVEEARSGALPTLTANGTYTRLDNDRTLKGSGTPATATTSAVPDRILVSKNQLSANITLSVPLVAAAQWARWSRASDAATVSAAQNQDVRRVVALLVARAYLSVLGQHRVKDVSDRAVDSARAHLTFAKSRADGGIGTRIDVVRAEQELDTSLVQAASASAALLRLQEMLGILIGADDAIDALADPELQAPTSESEAIADAESHRADVRTARLRYDASVSSLRQSWTDYMPSLVGLVQPFYQHPASFTTPETGWQAQLVLSWALYDGGLRYGLTHERAAAAAAAQAQLDGTLRQARSDVRTAYALVDDADRALAAAHGAAQLAATALELATMAYTAGAVTNLEVIDAERRARDAETAAAIAEDAARQARLDLLAGSGSFP